jgi:hypothetical protein
MEKSPYPLRQEQFRIINLRRARWTEQVACMLKGECIQNFRWVSEKKGDHPEDRLGWSIIIKMDLR